jgi:hypothetical protein
MVAKIILFPGLVERVARWMLSLLDLPTDKGHERELKREFDRVSAKFEIGSKDGLKLSDAQWRAVWHRVYILMSERKRADGEEGT